MQRTVAGSCSIVVGYVGLLMDRSVFGTMQPSDGATALRSLPRRFSEQFRPAELRGERDAARMDDAPEAGGPSPLQLVEATVNALEALGKATKHALLFDEPTFDGVFDRGPRDRLDAAPKLGLSQALDRLRTAADAFAEDVSRHPLADWARVAVVDGQRVEAIELLREAVATGRTYLDLLGPTLHTVRRQG